MKTRLCKLCKHNSSIDYTICANCGVERVNWEPKIQDYVPPKLADDLVNHPNHYTYGSIEVIDIIEALELDYHRGNALKYIARAGRKDDTHQDIEKAIWYLERYKNEVLK